MAKPSVMITYRIRGEEVNKFRLVATDTACARIGLPLDTVPIKPEAGSYDYSGTHDQGALSEPKEGGVVPQLIGCVLAAKAANNEYMTKIMQEEKKT